MLGVCGDLGDLWYPLFVGLDLGAPWCIVEGGRAMCLWVSVAAAKQYDFIAGAIFRGKVSFWHLDGCFVRLFVGLLPRDVKEERGRLWGARLS